MSRYSYRTYQQNLWEYEKRQYERRQIVQYLTNHGIYTLNHWTSYQNIESIKQNGGLFSLDEMNSRRIHYQPGGNELSHKLEKFPNYVHTSLCWKHPMFKDRRDVVLLEIDVSVLLEQDALFCNMNANDSNCDCGDTIDHLKNIDIDATQIKYYSPELLKKKQAEIMIKGMIPICFIKNL